MCLSSKDKEILKVFARTIIRRIVRPKKIGEEYRRLMDTKI